MSVNTKTVSGRRSVRYDSYDDVVADAERLAAGSVKTVGNWTFAQILEHLAISFNSSIDGIPFKVPLPMRIMGRLFFKSKFLNKEVPSGFQIPDGARGHFLPPDSTEVAQGIADLKAAVERCKVETQRCRHPLFGELTLAEWEKFGLRHAEMHMSFAMPADG